MQNDVLRNTIVPWQEKGRWYHGCYTADDHNFITNKTDKFLLDNYEITVPGTGYGVLRPKINTKPDMLYEPILCIYMCAGVPIASPTVLSDTYVVTSGRRGVICGTVNSTGGIVEFWVFIVYNSNNE